jgi:hypothetical protein
LLSTAFSVNPPLLPPPEDDGVVLDDAAVLAGVELEEDFELEPQADSARAPIATAQAASGVLGDVISCLSSGFPSRD